MFLASLDLGANTRYKWTVFTTSGKYAHDYSITQDTGIYRISLAQTNDGAYVSPITVVNLD